MDVRSPHEKSLFKIIVLGTALSFAVLGAIIASMKDFVHGDAAFSFSWRTLAGFALGFVIGWMPWRFLAKKMWPPAR